MRHEGAFGVHPVRDGRGLVVTDEVFGDWFCKVLLGVELMSIAEVVQHLFPGFGGSWDIDLSGGSDGWE